MYIQWNSVVLATIRILAAWMAEETTALKTEVCDLIPFLVQVRWVTLLFLCPHIDRVRAYIL